MDMVDSPQANRGGAGAGPSGPPAFISFLLVGTAVLFFGSFVYSAHLCDLALGREEWRYALWLGATLIAGPLTTWVVFLRPPRAVRAKAERRG